MRRFIIYILLVACCVTDVMGAKMRDEFWESKADTLLPVFPDEEPMASKNPDPKNLAVGLDAMGAVLESRYRGKDQGFSGHGWMENVFVSAGIGYDKFLPSNKELSFEALTMGRLSIGKKLAPYHTLRLSALLGTGYQNKYARRMYKADARLEYLLNLSAFSSGYNPTRSLDIHFMTGVGMMYTRLKGERAISSPEFYLGAQFDAFAGPFGRLHVEPIIGLTMDKIDFSENRNWKKFDLFYGINVGFTHYLDNSLKNMPEDVRSKYDSRSPFFFELANGFVVNNAKGVSMTESMGPEFTLSAGKWLSSGVGLRASICYSSSFHNKIDKTTLQTADQTMLSRQLYAAGRVEAMINPFGFVRKYNWDSSFGAYLLGGVGFGRLRQSDHKGGALSTNTESFTLGVHLWKKLRDDLHFFIEPRYTAYRFNIPYADVDWYLLEDNSTFTVNLGLSMMLRSAKDRQGDDYTHMEVDPECKLIAGVAGGMPLMMNKDNTYQGENGFSFNGLIYGEYLLSNHNVARLSAEFLSLSRAFETNYLDQVMQDVYVVSRNKRGLMNHRHNLAIVSAAYGIDIMKLATGKSSDSRFQAEAFFGLGCTLHLQETATLSSTEQQQKGHVAVLADKEPTTPYFCLTLGGKIVYNVTHKLGITLTPTLYLVNNMKLKTYSLPRVFNFSPLETINLGIQYRFKL